MKFRGLKLKQNGSEEPPTLQDEHQKWKFLIGGVDFLIGGVDSGATGGPEIHKKVTKMKQKTE